MFDTITINSKCRAFYKKFKISKFGTKIALFGFFCAAISEN